MKYRIARGTISHESGRLPQGSTFDADMFGADEIQSWLLDGRIVEDTSPDCPEASASLPQRPRGPWQCDPASLAGMELEQLHRLILDIEAGVDVSQLDEGESIRLLTRDFDARYAEPVAAAVDKSRPPLLNAHNLNAGDTRRSDHDLSPASQRALAAARARADELSQKGAQ